MSDATERRNRVTLTLVGCALAACLIGLSGCEARVVAGRAVAGPERLECVETSVPLVWLGQGSPDEPRIGIPTPPGWVPTEYFPGARTRIPAPKMGMIRNPSLQFGGHVPNALVVVDTFHPDPAVAGDVEQFALDDMIDDIDRSSEIVKQTPGRVCGHPSVRVDYVIEGLESTALIVASMASDRSVWRVRLNFLSHEPHNIQWLRDTQLMMEALVVDETPAR
ncbi:MULTISPECIES: hypothetical protein [Mycobacterium avium complex (MAC)]|uniref:hypothetical protein n=1 Tax=Mycobacterium avium complex (MAC) TaxID=120793 RepID=UPI00111C929B|nr:MULTISPECIES: hypothetical protein [Mycobacterium avium complex (MAC)]UCN12814.1 LpqN/LpqT family lipoprotein [Mycobacterium intracellulare subsp. chimaera]